MRSEKDAFQPGVDLDRRPLEAANRNVYGSASAAKAYARVGQLQRAESVIFERIAPSIRNQRFLDMGVGGGRTTAYLRQLTNHYIGIDYSPAMVQAARQKTGVSSIYCCDAQDMRRFEDQAFDFIFFSFNGLDYMTHPGRLQALREIYRVLATGGSFLFSSHNRSGDAARPPWNQRNRELSLHFAKTCLSTLAALPRHWRMRRQEIHEDEYTILNDPALGYSLMTYYIELPAQLAQLSRIGFAEAEAFDTHGRPTVEDHESPWIHYLARK